jgi:hypothetical protein
VIVLGGGIVMPPSNLHDAIIFDEGRYRLSIPLPSEPALSAGYRLISTASAYRSLRAFAAVKAGGSGPIVIIRSIRLGRSSFLTDRGNELLPAWLFFAKGLRHPAAVLAARPYPAPAPLRQRLPHLLIAELVDEFVAASHGGQTLTISFAGGHAGNQPCDDSYTANATERRTAVAFTIKETPAPGNAICNLVGYPRTVTIRLSRPLGARVLIDGADAIALPVSGLT